jgi:hypothetical protein
MADAKFAVVQPGDEEGAEWQHPKTHVPTPEQREVVNVLAAHGTQIYVIAKILRIGITTLKRHYRAELNLAFDELKAKIQLSVAKRALAGDLNACKYWLSRFCPEWRLPADLGEDTAAAPAAIAGPHNHDDGEVVHFYMPPNHRDEPEVLEVEGEVIEGEATAA